MIERNHQEAIHVLARALIAQGMRREAMTICERAFVLRDVRRWHVIQAVIAATGARTYLEIGIADGQNILRVDAPVKIGVDPIAPSLAVQAAIDSGSLTYCPNGE